MAIIKKRSKHWTAIFRDGQGKQVWRVLSGITNKREAKAAADMLEDAAQRRRNGARLKRTFNEFYKQSYGEASCGASSLRDFVTTWLKQKQREVSASTLEAYTKSTGTLIDFMGARADGDISEISKRDLLAFREHLLSTGRGSTTVNKYVCQLKLLFKDAQKDEYTIDNAATFLESVKGDGMKRHPFSVAEIRVILDAASPEWRSLVMFGIYTGQRLGDLARLTWANIDTARGEIRLTTQKTKKRMTIPIAEPLMNHISQLPSSDDPASPVFPNAFTSVKTLGKVSTLSQRFSALLASVGLAKAGLSFHSLRHSAVTFLKEAGVPEAVVMELVGHDSKAVSAGYTSVGNQALKDAVAKFSSF